jgi:hypothetical protein
MLVGTGVDHPQAQARNEAVKAAFLFNFVKFTEWPGLAANTPLAVCVMGDDEIADALVTTVGNQLIGGRPLELNRTTDENTWPSCHLLFVSEAEANRSARALRDVQSLPILTVSDAKGFARGAGIVEFFTQGNRMRFAINVAAAERAGLHISSRLLGLAEVVGGSE